MSLNLGLICCVVIGNEHTTTPSKFTRFLSSWSAFPVKPCCYSQSTTAGAPCAQASLRQHSSLQVTHSPSVPAVRSRYPSKTPPCSIRTCSRSYASLTALGMNHLHFFFYSIFFLIIKVIHINYGNLENSKIYLNGSLNNA